MATSYSNRGGTGLRTSIITAAVVGATSGSVNVLIDGVNNTGFFFSNGATSTYTITFDFGSGQQYIIDEAKWYQDNATTHGVWKFQGSNNLSTWTDIGSSFTLGGTAQVITAINGNTTAYSAYRLQGISGGTSSSPWLYEIEFKISEVQDQRISISDSILISDSARPSSVPALIGTVTVNGLNSGTTATLDTTGASLLVIHISHVYNVVPTVSDSKGNPWTLGATADSGLSGAGRIFYVLNPTVGTGHTFSFSGTGTAGRLIAAAFSGPVGYYHTTGPGVVGGLSATSISPGPLITGEVNELVVSGFAWNDNNSTATITESYTITNSHDLVGGTSYGGAFAYKVISTIGSTNPTWGNGATGRREATIISFSQVILPTDFAPHDLTGNSSHSPYISSASSNFSSSFQAYRAFDGGVGTYWLGSTAVDWLRLDVGDTHYSLHDYTVAVNDWPEPNRAPKNWTMEGSGDGITWVVLDTVTNQTSWSSGENRNFICDVIPGAFNRFRINITANNGDSIVQVAELYLYGIPGINPYDGLAFSDFVAYSLGTPNNGTIVQAAQVRELVGPTTTARMLRDVTAGNFLIVMTGHPGGDECTGGFAATYSDTRGLTFTAIADAENVSGGQSNSCIIMAPITSSGPEIITRTRSSSNYPVSMWVIEVSGILGATLASASGGTADSGTSVNSGNVTSTRNGMLFAAVGSDSNDALNFITASPSNSTVVFMAPEGVFLAKFVDAGTYSATFTKPPNGFRWSAAAVLIASDPGLISVSDSISIADSISITIAGQAAFTFLIIDSLGLADELVADVEFLTPIIPVSPLHPFEFYGMDTPEDVEILPVPKKYDQVGPVRFDKIGKIFGFRVRLIASGITESMPYKIFGDDSESLDHLNSPLFFDSFTVRPGLDNVYEIQLPKSVNTDIVRITFGPVDFPFHRYDVLIKVHVSGMKGQAKWIPIR